MEKEQGERLPEILARNVRAFRALRGMDQEAVAVGMQSLGHSKWVAQTVGQVEKGRREVKVDEFFGLCYVLTALPTELLLPMGSERFPAGFPKIQDRFTAQQWLASAFRIGQHEPTITVDRETGEIQ